MAKSKSVTSRIIDLNSFRSIASFMMDSEDWIDSVHEREGIFQKMRDDPRIESLIQDRKNKVLQLYGSLTPTGNKKVDTACETFLSFNIFYKLNNILLNAVPYGIALCEVLWDFKDGLFVPKDFVPIPRTAIHFPRYDNIAFGTPVLMGQNIPLEDGNKFIIHRNDDGELSQWGRPALRSAYMFWKFKQLGVKFWAQAAEIVGSPSILALFETKSEAEAKARASQLTAAMADWKGGSSGALGNVSSVQVISSQINDFSTIVSTCDMEIAYALTAQSLSTNQTEYGTRAQSDTHTKTYDEIVKGDAYLLQLSDQKLVNAFMALNFPGEKVPTYDVDSSDFANWEIIRDAIDRNIPVSLSALYKKIHLPEPEDENDAFTKPANSGFGFGDKAKENFFFQR